MLGWDDGGALVSREKPGELASTIAYEALLVHADAGHNSRWDDPARFSHGLHPSPVALKTAGPVGTDRR
jgi:hypothetical protein